MLMLKKPRDVANLRKFVIEQRDTEKKVITICGGTGCKASKSDSIVEAFKEELVKQGISDSTDLRITGCHGFCEKGPIVLIKPENYFYPNVKPDQVPRIVTETVINDEIIEEFLYKDPATGGLIIHEHNIPFYKNQKRTIFADNGLIDPTSFEDYLALGGYSAISKVLGEMTPEEVIKEMKDAGLKGRGGAGFPTGLKWEFMSNAPGEKRYVICNADEGDPGAYMDRSLLEGNPHCIIEGMLIGAYAMGTNHGYIYLRAEYPLALHNVRIAMAEAKEMGLLGDNILGTGFNFDLEIYQGAGAFVCGEETALIASIEGREGEPRQRPPYPAQSGLWGYPTCINNVETWANVRHIINRGSEWFSGTGTLSSKGTKIFSLVGKINNIGLVEIPFGTTLREIIFSIGGGISNNRKFKAVQTGGPSGGCVPEDFLDVAIDYANLSRLGSIMGSGGMIVMDEDTCMVDVARYFTAFSVDESCGKCTSCREGNARMLEILDDICAGVGSEEDLQLLVELSRYIKNTSMCGLGNFSSNPVLSTLRYFKDEYLAHIERHACPAKVCKDLIRYKIKPDYCMGCTLCARKCPVKAISGERKKPHVIDQDVCTKCGSCHTVCRFSAVDIETGVD